jgi:hypothetical protein
MRAVSSDQQLKSLRDEKVAPAFEPEKIMVAGGPTGSMSEFSR